MPSATPEELATAIIECIDAGARVINLSLALAQPSVKGEQALEQALNQAARRGVIVVAAAGNQGTLGSSAITRHPWVIPVVACDLRGRPMNESNLGSSIGRRGLSAPGDSITSLGSEGQSLTLRRNECCGAVCDGGDCAVVVGLSFRNPGANQTRHFQVLTAASLGSSAFAGCRGGLPDSVDSECKEAKHDKKIRCPDKEHLPPRTPAGFITDEEIGLGDVIKRTTSYFGIQPCGGCDADGCA